MNRRSIRFKIASGFLLLKYTTIWLINCCKCECNFAFSRCIKNTRSQFTSILSVKNLIQIGILCLRRDTNFNFYRNENLVADSVKLNPWMAKMAIPIWIVCAIFFSFDYSHMIIRLQGSDEWFMASTIVYVVLSGLLAIYFIITSSRVMARLNNGLRNHRSATHRKVRIVRYMLPQYFINYIYLDRAQSRY